MKKILITLSLIVALATNTTAQLNILKNQFKQNLRQDEIIRSYVTPVKIIWQSDTEGKQVIKPEALLTRFDGQLSTSGAGMCMLRSDDDKQASVLLDFGTELYGGIEIAAAIRGGKRNRSRSGFAWGGSRCRKP